MSEAAETGVGAMPPMVETEEKEVPVVDFRLRDTGNGAEVSYEEDLLRQYFGEPDADGVYGRGASDDRP